MSKRNAAKVLDNYFTGYSYYNKRDRMRLQDNEEITNNGTLMAYIYENMNTYDDYVTSTYLVVSMQDFKSQPTWKKDRDDLVELAKSPDYGMRVIFVPELDIGFGVSKLDFNWLIVSNIYFALNRYLLKVAKFSTNNRNAVMAIKLTDNLYNKILGIAVDQVNPNGTISLAEEILTDFITSLDDYSSEDEYIYISLREPDYKGLQAMIQNNARFIYYAYPNCNPSTEYIQLANDVWSKDVCHPTTNHSIHYDKVYSIKVEKFYDKEKSE